jgi:hypothetical protein
MAQAYTIVEYDCTYKVSVICMQYYCAMCKMDAERHDFMKNGRFGIMITLERIL